MSPPPYDAIVLAGGTSRRLGGVDKTSLVVAGRPMLDHVLDAVADARTIVVVGPSRPTTREVCWRREDPVGGGPAAAVAAALPAVTADIAVVVAGDQPLLSAAAVGTLVRSLDDGDGVVALDADGEPQWLVGAWRTAALARARLEPHASLRDTLGALRWAGVALPAHVTDDCDTEDDVRRVEAALTERGARA